MNVVAAQAYRSAPAMKMMFSIESTLPMLWVATGRPLQAHGPSRRTSAQLRYGYAGVRLDQNPIPRLHKTQLRIWEPVRMNSE